jgi:hypothetical protein
MEIVERVPELHGRWRFDVYDGDVERVPLTTDQVRENEVFARLGLPFPLHVGAVVSKPINTFEGENTVTTTGKGLILDRIFALGSVGQITHMGVGASATASAVTDTQLNTTPTLLAFDSLPTRAALVVTAIRTFATGEANINWQECAMFNGSVNGTSVMLNRIAPIGAFNKTSAVSIGLTCTLTQS